MRTTLRLIQCVMLTLIWGCEDAPPSPNRLIRLGPKGSSFRLLDANPRFECANEDRHQSIVRQDFEQEAPGHWQSCSSVEDFGISVLESLSPPQIIENATNSYLRFERTAGLYFTHLPVTPLGCYRFRARVRSASELPHHGSLVIMELKDPIRDQDGRDLHQLVAQASILNRHELKNRASDRSDFQERSLEIRASHATRALVVGIMAGLLGQAHADFVEIDDIDFAEVPLRSHLARHPEEIPSKIDIYGDTRDGYWLPGPASLEFSLTCPVEALLDFAIGAPPEPSLPPRDPASLRVLVTDQKHTRTVFERSFDRSEKALPWQECQVDLSRWQNQSIRIQFELSGGENTLYGLGSPLIRGPWQSPPPPSVVFISIDTLGSDHLQNYGYARKTSPFLHTFFTQEGVTLDAMVASSSFTIPTHASLFTGQYPSVHGVSFSGRRLSPEVNPHLAEILQARGYLTLGFTGGKLLESVFGFDRGFDHYSTLDPLMTEPNPYRQAFPLAGETELNAQVYEAYSLQRVIDAIDRCRRDPFFLFFHTYLVHDYSPPQKDLDAFVSDHGFETPFLFGPEEVRASIQEGSLSPQRVEKIKWVYDTTIEMADRAVRRIIEHLKKRSLLDRTLVILVSDHGEEFLEHGGLFHAQNLYQEVIKVPLMIYDPTLGRSGHIRGGVHQVDIAPTILDRLGLEAPWRMQGQSLYPLLRGEKFEASPLLSELAAPSYGMISSLQKGGWKWIETRTPTQWVYRLNSAPRGIQLFNLDHDPGETQSLPQESIESLGLEAEFRRQQSAHNLFRSRIGGDEDSNRLRSTTLLRKRLEAIGYAAPTKDEGQ